MNGDGVQDADTSMGDFDDVLMFTVRSHGEPFVGRFQGTSIESQLAEVIWWINYDDTDGNGSHDFGEPYMLYRRLLLIRPDLNLSGAGGSERVFFNNNDVSARPDPSGAGMIANSLSDLTKRENRYAHRLLDVGTPTFPFAFRTESVFAKFGPFLGEDVMLSDVLSFDVRVYDPQAPLDVSGAVVPAALVPGDPGYVPAQSIARGAYVDLNYARDGSTPLYTSLFSGPSHPKSRLSSMPYSVYDTWPEDYERDGIDQDPGRNLGVDQGTNGLDDDNLMGVDDVGERETAPPYGVPLRGLQVTIRLMDFNTRQVHQVSVVGDFVPE
jgi:hypothetical protein